MPAGDNVVRLLPPLIVGEAEVDEAVRRLDARARGADAARRRRVTAVTPWPPRHFLDLSELPAETLRGILDDSRRHEGRRRAASAASARSKAACSR